MEPTFLIILRPLLYGTYYLNIFKQIEIKKKDDKYILLILIITIYKNH